MKYLLLVTLISLSCPVFAQGKNTNAGIASKRDMRIVMNVPGKSGADTSIHKLTPEELIKLNDNRICCACVPVQNALKEKMMQPHTLPLAPHSGTSIRYPDTCLPKKNY